MGFGITPFVIFRHYDDSCFEGFNVMERGVVIRLLLVYGKKAASSLPEMPIPTLMKIDRP